MITIRKLVRTVILLICLSVFLLVCWQYCNSGILLTCYTLQCSSRGAQQSGNEQTNVAIVSFYNGLSLDDKPSPSNTGTEKQGADVEREVFNSTILPGTKTSKEHLHIDATTLNIEHSKLSTGILGRESIKEEMKQCSLALGVSPDNLEIYDDKMNKIATKASTFLDTLREFIPENFIPGWKNPCWYSNLTVSQKVANKITSKLSLDRNDLSVEDIDWLSGQLFDWDQKSRHQKSNDNLYCLPFFFLAGFAKSGTTTLHSMLSHHPHIAPPEMKEPHWWTRTPLGEMDHDYLRIAIVRYLINFSSASKTIKSNSVSEQIITDDGSSSLLPDSMFKEDYIDFCAMVSVISRVLPNVKIIVLIRDPISRAYSQFYYMHGPFNKWPQEMKENAPLYFHKYTLLAVSDFYDCLSQNKSDYECAHEVTRGRTELNTWVGLGIYYIHILKWMQFFPRENFLFLRTDELNNTHGVWNTVTNFLGLDPISDSIASMLSSKKKNVRNDFLNNEAFEMMPETRSLLEGFYSPYNAKLAHLLGEEMFAVT